MTQQGAVAPTTAELDGRHDFDFHFGEWRIANRKLEDPFAEEPKWLEFEATSEARPILDGLGNVELYTAPDFPGRGRYHGFSLRLFDPGERVWKIWWASTYLPGELDTPVVGRFEDGVGRFETDDSIGGNDVRVRYDWTDITESSGLWTQSFSFDGGRTFVPNWIMENSRVA